MHAILVTYQNCCLFLKFSIFFISELSNVKIPHNVFEVLLGQNSVIYEGMLIYKGSYFKVNHLTFTLILSKRQKNLFCNNVK